MASTDKPFTRKEWNDLLESLNEKIENPPPATFHGSGSSCSALDPIDPVDECHRWSVEDINEVWDRLEEADPEEACDSDKRPEFEPECNKWKLEYIEDIEAAIEKIWCDCDPIEGAPPCENCGDPGGITEYYRVTPQLYLQDANGSDYTSDEQIDACAEQVPPGPEVATVMNGIRQEVDDQTQLYIDSIEDACTGQIVLDRFITPEREQCEDELEQDKADRDAACADDPGGGACAFFTQVVENKEQECQDLRDAEDAKIQEIADNKAQAADAADAADAAAEAGWSYVSAIDFVCRVGVNRAGVIRSALGSHPWILPFEENCGGISAPAFDRCRFGVGHGSRTSTDANSPDPAMAATPFTPGGVPYPNFDNVLTNGNIDTHCRDNCSSIFNDNCCGGSGGGITRHTFNVNRGLHFKAATQDFPPPCG